MSQPALAAPAAGKSIAYTYSKSVVVKHRGGHADYRTTISVGALKPGTVAAISSGNQGKCANDGSLSVESCIRLYYNVQVCDGGTNYCYDVYQDTVKYTNVDPHDATLNTGDWVEGANGKCLINCGSVTYVSGTHDYGTHPVSSGTAYNYTGHWKGKYIEVNSTYGENHGGHSTLNWHYRGTAKTLTVYFNLTDAP